MKRILLSLALLIVAISASAQSNGLNPVYNVSVGEVKYEIPKPPVTAGKVIGTLMSAAAGVVTDKHHEDRLPAVIAAVKSGISNARRLKVVDNIAEGDEGLVITAEVTGITTTQKTRIVEKVIDGKKTRSSEIYYVGNVRISITEKNLATNEVTTRNFYTSSSSWGYIALIDDALDHAIKHLAHDIHEYFNDRYPLRANIIEPGTVKKDKQKEVYIDLGSANDVTPDMHLYVYEVGEVAGREVNKKIGRIRINEVLGDDISICRVKSGGKDIKKCFDEGKKLVVVSGSY